MTCFKVSRLGGGIMVVALALLLSGCPTYEELQARIRGEATISGVITDDSTGQGLDAVTITAIDPTGAFTFDPVTTDTNGNYSITVTRNVPLYFRIKKDAGYVTVNSSLDSYDSDQLDVDIPMYTTSKTQSVITQAFSFNPSLTGWSWLFVDVVTGNGDDASDITITASDNSGALIDATATHCDGTNSGNIVTIACTGSDTRDGPMYIAYYDSDVDITVTISGARSGEQSAPVRLGQVTYVKFELSTL